MIMAWFDVDIDKDIINYFKIQKVPVVLVINPKKKEVESIKNPKKATLTKIIGAYEEYYRLKAAMERNETFEEIEDKLSLAAVVIFIKGNV